MVQPTKQGSGCMPSRHDARAKCDEHLDLVVCSIILSRLLMQAVVPLLLPSKPLSEHSSPAARLADHVCTASWHYKWNFVILETVPMYNCSASSHWCQ